MKVRVIPPSEIPDVIPVLAQLRIEVFKSFPYLYDGDLEYERDYLRAYEDSERAIIVGAFEGGRLVGAATGTPLGDHHDEFSSVFLKLETDVEKVFYCAESVLLPEWRGQGIGHRFFDEREAHARRLGFSHSCFCGVIRDGDHPARPKDYSPLDRFWKSRGYEKLDGVTTSFSWKDIGDVEETAKVMQFWMRSL